MAIDVTAIESEARFLIGSLSTDVVSSTNMQIIIAKGVAKYSTDDSDYCNVLYYTVVETLRYLIRVQAVANATSSSTGIVTQRSEKEGSVTITEQYSEDSDSDVPSTWNDLLDIFLANPQYVCESLAVTDGLAPVIIGDGDVDGVTAAFNSRTKYDQAVFNVRTKQQFPWRNRY